MQQPWLAPRAVVPVDATVALPGSKSMTARALVLAALADGPSLVERPLRARDTDLMAAALRALGTDVADAPGASWRVTPGPPRAPAEIDVGLAGTVMRFLPAVAALASGPVRFDGDSRARERPLGPLLDGLGQVGVDVRTPAGDTLPLTVHGSGRVTGGAVTLDASASSQFVSGLLLAAPRFDKGIELRHAGPPMPSAPHVRMTVAMLRRHGVDIDDSTPDLWRVLPGPIQAHDVAVEPDLSAAAPFLAAALVTGGQITVPGWPRETTQPGDALRHVLTEMGARVSHDGTALTVRGGGTIHGVDADLREVSELMPVLAALAALADSPSRLRGLAHVRGHETDRLAALRTELTRLGAEVSETTDGLVIRPRPLTGGLVSTYDDHRIAMAGAVLGLAVGGVRVENVATTGKTLPGFVDMWSRMLEGAP